MFRHHLASFIHMTSFRNQVTGKLVTSLSR